MIRTGRVVAEKDGQIEVCFERPEACAKCGACGGGKHISQVKIPGSAPVGSMVAVDMPEGQVLKASAVAYVIPLLLLLAGIALGMGVGLCFCVALGRKPDESGKKQDEDKK